VRFEFADTLRPDAAQVVAELLRQGLAVELLSGDRETAVRAAAEAAGIASWRARLSPAEKVAHLEALAARGRKVLMVGDGLNDAPALAAAHASLSPASAVDVSQTAADAVFQGRSLAPVIDCIRTARRVNDLVRQNIGLAFVYNALTVPLAMLGFVTPLVAAISMSASSVLVVGNALRLKRG
jgi:Cu2+-exporting ATPase